MTPVADQTSRRSTVSLPAATRSPEMVGAVIVWRATRTSAQDVVRDYLTAVRDRHVDEALKIAPIRS
jgi:hypothetical protein